MARINPNTLGELKEQVVFINRVAKVVKGGKRFAFTALVTVGDGNGHVGIGSGKAREVSEAIRKATEDAKKSIQRYAIIDGKVPYRVIGNYGASRVILRPAGSGTGVIAGDAVRFVLEACGVKDILTKSLGSNNRHNLVKATLDGLSQLRHPDDIRNERFKTKAPAAKAPVAEPPAAPEEPAAELTAAPEAPAADA